MTRYGWAEWTVGGEDYYLQFMPPSLQDNAAPPKLLIAPMDHAGVDQAVLQNDHLYGHLNDFFADAVRRFPRRLIGLARVEESRAYAPDQLGERQHGPSQLLTRLPKLMIRGIALTGLKG